MEDGIINEGDGLQNWLVESIMEPSDVVLLSPNAFEDKFEDGAMPSIDYSYSLAEYKQTFSALADVIDDRFEDIVYKGEMLYQNPYIVYYCVPRATWKDLLDDAGSFPVDKAVVEEVLDEECRSQMSMELRKGLTSDEVDYYLERISTYNNREGCVLTIHIDLATRLARTSALSISQARAYALRKVGYSIADIAREMGVETGTASSHVNRAERKMDAQESARETKRVLESITVGTAGLQSREDEQFYAPGGEVVTVVDTDLLDNTHQIEYPDGQTETVPIELVSTWVTPDESLDSTPASLQKGSRFWNPEQERYEWFLDTDMEDGPPVFLTEDGMTETYRGDEDQLEYMPPHEDQPREQRCPTPLPMDPCESDQHEFPEPVRVDTSTNYCERCGLNPSSITWLTETYVSDELTYECVFCEAQAQNSDWYYSTPLECVSVCPDCRSDDLSHDDVPSKS